MPSLSIPAPDSIPTSTQCASCGEATASPGFLWADGSRSLCPDDFHLRQQLREASDEEVPHAA